MSEHPQHEIPGSRCPRCDHKLDRASPSEAKEQQPPIPGDITVCIRCGTGLVFDADLALRYPTEDERKQMEADPIFRRTQWAIRTLHSRLN